MTSAHQKAAQMLAAAADLLDQGQLVNRLSITATAIALGVMLLPIFPASEVMAPTAVLVTLAGITELVLAMRVSLDAALFRRLANDAAGDRLDVAAFDAALLALRLMPAGRAGAPIAKRFAGAKRLLMLQGTALAIQMLIAIAGAGAVFFGWI